MPLTTAAGRLLTLTMVGVGGTLALVAIPVAGLVAVLVLGGVAAVMTAPLRWVGIGVTLLGISSSLGRVTGLCTAFVACAGFTAVLGVSGLAVAVGTVGSGIWLCSRTRGAAADEDRSVGRSVGGSVGGLSADTAVSLRDDPAPVVPSNGPASASQRATVDLSDVELCRAWRISYLLLSRCVDPDAANQIIGQRQEYLDEFERRHPGGFARWMASGARAASDPQPFLGPSRGEAGGHAGQTQLPDEGLSK